jgi:GT2 family glycosyltransferase
MKFDEKHDIEFIFIGNNIGYGSAHNIAMKKAIDQKFDYHIVLNPDISFSNSIVDEILDFMENNPDVNYLLPKVIYPNGELQYLCKKLPSPFIMFARRFLPKIGFIKKINDDFELRRSGYDEIINPPCLSGCFMFLRLSVINSWQIFFDQRFFMYYEDFDLIRRLHRIGKTVFFPMVTITHSHARQAYTSKKMLLVFIKSTFKYFNKYGWFFDKERYEMNHKIDMELLGDN